VHQVEAAVRGRLAVKMQGVESLRAGGGTELYEAVRDSAKTLTDEKESNRIHQELQRQLLGLSTNSRQVIATKAGHNIQREEPQLVIDAVLDVVKQVRVASKR